MLDIREETRFGSFAFGFLYHLQHLCQTAVVLDEGGACATIIGGGGFLGSKFLNVVVCTKAHYHRHLIGSYLKSANQASSFNACNVETSFTASNW